MNTKRPINVNPLSIRLPLSALVSIAHRLSGILVFLLIPILLWGFQRSLASPEGLNQVKECFSAPVFKFVIWALLSATLFHLCAGCRHLLMDMRIGDSLRGGRWGAILVLCVSALLIIGTAYWMWR